MSRQPGTDAIAPTNRTPDTEKPDSFISCSAHGFEGFFEANPQLKIKRIAINEKAHGASH